MQTFYQQCVMRENTTLALTLLYNEGHLIPMI